MIEDMRESFLAQPDSQAPMVIKYLHPSSVPYFSRGTNLR